MYLIIYNYVQMRPADLDNIYWTQTKGDRQACQKIMKEDVNSNSQMTIIFKKNTPKNWKGIWEDRVDVEQQH